MDNQLNKSCCHEVGKIQKHWGWFLLFGILLIALGLIMISSVYYTTIFSVVFLGALLLAAGLVQIVQAFIARQWSGLFFSLLVGILYLVVGFFCISKPTQAAIALTFWMAAFFMIAGLFRMLSSAILRFEHWGWVFFNGLISLILGIMIYAEWPVSGLWVIGLFLGIDIILSGWTWIMLSLTCKPCSK